MAEHKKSKTLIEKLILFSVFMIFAGIVVGFAFSWNYVEEDDGNTTETEDTGVYQYVTVSKPDTSETVSSATSSTNAVTTKININTATLEELDTLPGIGPSKAEAIINYRTNESVFLKIEDIKDVKGIGDKLFEQIKDYITVN